MPGPKVLRRWVSTPERAGGCLSFEALEGGLVRIVAGDDPWEYVELEPAEAQKAIRDFCDALELATRPK